MREFAGARTRAALLLWRDYFGAVHACERNDLRQAFYVFNTLCGRNVPPNARWPDGPRPGITCAECARAASAAARKEPAPSHPKEEGRAQKRPNYAEIGA